MEIYYFSGTGNSLAVARGIAEGTGATLVSIPSVIDRQRIPVAADAMGMVFPVYHKSIPLILKRFVEKLEGLDGKYIFAIYTCGDTSGMAPEHLDRLLKSRGGELDAGFSVQLPYNYITPRPVLRDFFGSFTLREIPAETQEALLAAAPEKIERIAAAVRARQSGAFETSADLLTRLADRFHLEESLAKWSWLKIAGVDEATNLSFIESRQLMDQAFQVDEQCNECSVCARICPVHNIEMVDGRPVWQQRCEQCFACLHWCPQEAIQFRDNTAGQRRYHHPDVTLADMLRQAAQER